MMITDENLLQPASVGVLFVRLLLAILFIWQGYDKIFKLKINSVIQIITPSYAKLKIPNFMIKLVAYYTSYIEFFGGLLLFIGMFKYFSLYLLGIDLLIVSFGMSVLDPVWKMDIVLPRFMLLIFLLLIPPSWDIYCLQNLL